MLPAKEKRVCKYSKTEFIPKRNNQIFANKECRVAYHNDANNAFRAKLNTTNKEILNDYKVVDSILADFGEITVNKHYLRGAGFSSKKFTNVINVDGETVFCLYDISFQKLNNEDYYIKRIR
jgi:hypothetical protein